MESNLFSYLSCRQIKSYIYYYDVVLNTEINKYSKNTKFDYLFLDLDTGELRGLVLDSPLKDDNNEDADEFSLCHLEFKVKHG